MELKSSHLWTLQNLSEVVCPVPESYQHLMIRLKAQQYDGLVSLFPVCIAMLPLTNFWQSVETIWGGTVEVLGWGLWVEKKSLHFSINKWVMLLELERSLKFDCRD